MPTQDLLIQDISVEEELMITGGGLEINFPDIEIKGPLVEIDLIFNSFDIENIVSKAGSIAVEDGKNSVNSSSSISLFG